MTEPEILPVGMQKKHGSYYFVAALGDKRKWIRLGKSFGDACNRMQAIKNGSADVLPPARTSDEKDWLTDSFRIMLSNSRGRARKQGLEHTLTMDDLREIANEGRYCCAVTGMLFSNEKIGHSGTRPFFPSIDRIESQKGYVKGNCRLVIVLANYAMNSWGEEIFTKIAVAHLRKRGYAVRSSKSVRESAIS